MSKILSKRATEILKQTNILHAGMVKVSLNPFNEKNNFKGIINLGTAENKLNNKELLEKLNEIQKPVDDSVLPYGSFSGSEATRRNIANLLNRHLNPKQEINSSQIFVGNGCGVMVDIIGTTLCDVGDAIIVPEPYYGGFNSDLLNRSGVNVIPVGHTNDDVLGITEEMLEEVYSKNKDKIKGILISNPNNPFGRTYTAEQLLVFIKFAHKYGLQFISDEIYALSQFKDTIDGENANFVSVLALDLPNVNNVHVLWGLSKDFCMNGYRVGVIVSRSKSVIASLNSYCSFTCIPSTTDATIAGLLESQEWTDKFVSLNKSRLNETYKKLIVSLKEHQIEYVDANAGYFIWINLQPYLHLFSTENNKTLTEAEAENKLWLRLLDQGIYIAPGAAFYSSKPGYFRVCFGVKWEILNEALNRIYQVVGKSTENKN